MNRSNERLNVLRLQEMVDQASPGDHVTIPQGEYLLDQPLVIDKPLHISGQNLVHFVVTGYFHAIDIRASRVSLGGISFVVEIESALSDKYNFQDPAELRYHLHSLPALIHAYSITECKLHDCVVNANRKPFHGVYLKECKSVEVEKLRVKNTICGVVSHKTKSISLYCNQCSGDIFGVLLLKSKGKICSNDCYNNFGAGIALQEKSFAHITDNRCHDNKEAGIFLHQSKGRIHGNECYGNEKSGIALLIKSFAHITDNRCHDNKQTGILLAQSKGRIHDNECYGNELSGIPLQEKSFAHITDNRCHDNKNAGIALDQSKGRISRNECFGNRSGIQLQISSRGFVRNNICRENRSGIVLVYGAYAAITGNWLYQNREFPVVFVNSDRSDSTVEDNIEQVPEHNELEQSWLARKPLGLALSELRKEIDRVDNLHSFVRSGCVGCFNRYWLS